MADDKSECRGEVEEALEFDHEHQDPVIRLVSPVLRLAVRVLALILGATILWGIADVVHVIYQRLISPPVLLIATDEFFAIFGALLAVLISIEIFANVKLYLTDDTIHVELVIATALIAVARKVIVLDYSKVGHDYVWATAAVVISLGVTYWLLTQKRKG